MSHPREPRNSQDHDQSHLRPPQARARREPFDLAKERIVCEAGKVAKLLALGGEIARGVRIVRDIRADSLNDCDYRCEDRPHFFRIVGDQAKGMDFESAQNLNGSA